jgi:hypothetical protein
MQPQSHWAECIGCMMDGFDVSYRQHEGQARLDNLALLHCGLQVLWCQPEHVPHAEGHACRLC